LALATTVIAAGALAFGGADRTAIAELPASQQPTTAANAPANFGPSNPFYAASTLPFQAPPFDRIHDSDYQPAIEAGMAQQRV
jgi:hypothetical protein